MRRISLSLALCVIASTVIAALQAPAQAKAPLKCSPVTTDGKDFRICSGRVGSPEGTELLDVDVTLPALGNGPFPLIVMLHGIGGSKSEMESTTIEGSGDNFHQNNLWFASRGYSVMTYTTRGYRPKTGELGNECLDPSVEAADADAALYDQPSPACLPQVPHVKHEVKDTKHLVGRLVDGTLLSATGVRVSSRIGVYGRSYGGGHTWLLSRQNTWRSPEGTKVRVVAAVPVRGWTDLVDALLPNGRGRPGLVPTTDRAEREAERPGVYKQSYVEIFYAALQVRTHGADGQQVPGYLAAWRDRFKAGEPYAEDEIVQDAIHKLLTNRSAYYVAKKSFDTAVLGVQAWTDHVFGATQVVSMFNRLHLGDSEYPIRLYLGDAMGHAIAQNKTGETAYIAGLVNSWFDHYLKGKGTEPDAGIEARTVDCGPDLGDLYQASDWVGLQSSTPVFDLGMAGALETPVTDAHSHELDPIQLPGQVSNRCRMTDTAVATGNLAAEVPLPDGLDMLGVPTVTLDADPTATEMYVAAHLWDVDPATGMQTLVDRGVYRLGSDEPQTFGVFQLFGNAYSFAPGHILKLELTADDSPSFGRYPTAGSISISNVSLAIPEANASTLVP
jgi:predicted acyl esterase